MNPVRNIGGLVTTKGCIVPTNSADAATFGLVGSTIFKKDAASALIVLATGASTGTPDSMSVAAKLQESALNADGSTPTAWTDVATSPTNPAVTLALAGASLRAHLEVDLTKLKEVYRLVATVAHVGGTTPKTLVTAESVHGGLLNTPPTHA